MTKMTRQHFRAFAHEIRKLVTTASDLNEVDSREVMMIARETARSVAIVCRQFSPSFNVAEFNKACGLED